MARCGCSNTTCSCQIIGAGAITVTGSGTVTNPYVVNGGLALEATNTNTVTMISGGSGTIDDPYILAAHASLSLADLEDVVATDMTTGYVLARQADGTFALVPPATTAPGTINRGNGLSGDGSSGSPLNVRLAANSGLEIVSTGLRVQSSGGWASYTPRLRTSQGQFLTLPAGTSLRGRWKRDGNTVHLNINLEVGNNFPKLPGRYMMTLPVADRGTLRQILPAHAMFPEMNTTTDVQHGERQGLAMIEGDGYITRIRFDKGNYSARAIDNRFPEWVPGTKITISGSYETA
jgi:hypothetical protein